jgi:hypothetical protein
VLSASGNPLAGGAELVGVGVGLEVIGGGVVTVAEGDGLTAGLELGGVVTGGVVGAATQFSVDTTASVTENEHV